MRALGRWTRGLRTFSVMVLTSLTHALRRRAGGAL